MKLVAIWTVVGLALPAIGAAQAPETAVEQQARLQYAYRNVVLVDAPVEAADWWRDLVQACACQPQFQLADISWYILPGYTVPCTNGQRCAGFFDASSHTLLLAAERLREAATVQHELLHVILGSDRAHRHPLWRQYPGPRS